MAFRDRIEQLRFKRNLRIAKKRWSRVVASSVYNQHLDRRERRQLVKQTLRDIGYKRIRIIERKGA